MSESLDAARDMQHQLVRSPLAPRIGFGVSEAWAERKREILDAAAEINGGAADAAGHDALAVIIASLYVGTDVICIAAALSEKPSFVAGCSGRLQEAGVWLRDTMYYPWLEEDEATAQAGAILDSLVAIGEVEKVGPDSYRLVPTGVHVDEGEAS